MSRAQDPLFTIIHRHKPGHSGGQRLDRWRVPPRFIVLFERQMVMCTAALNRVRPYTGQTTEEQAGVRRVHCPAPPRPLLFWKRLMVTSMPEQVRMVMSTEQMTAEPTGRTRPNWLLQRRSEVFWKQGACCMPERVQTVMCLNPQMVERPGRIQPICRAQQVYSRLSMEMMERFTRARLRMVMCFTRRMEGQHGPTVVI